MNVRLQVLKALRIIRLNHVSLPESIAIVEGADSTSHSRALIREIVYGIMRQKLRLDYELEQLVQRRTDPDILDALRLGLFQIRFLRGMPDYVSVFETVKIVKDLKDEKIAGFVNAVLRTAIRKGPPAILSHGNDPTFILAVEYSHPKWLLKRWINRFGIEQTRSLCQWNNEIPNTTARLCTHLHSVQEIRQSLESQDFRIVDWDFGDRIVRLEKSAGLFDTDQYRNYEIFIQDEISQRIAALITPVRGLCVLDACCGRGGKGLLLADRIGIAGELFAIDRSREKLHVFKNIADNIRINNIIFVQFDLCTALPIEKKFDAAILDAPCTGLGMVHRHPEARWRLSPRDIKRLSLIQSALLNNVAVSVKQGGYLYYIVCSFEPEETINVIRLFLNQHREFVKVPFPRGEFTAEFFNSEGDFISVPFLTGKSGFFGSCMRKVGE